jgi:phosphopantetheinyl transferase
MAVYYSKQIDKDSQIVIWEITESLNDLLQLSRITKGELEESGGKNPKRQLEWVAIRLLIKKMLGDDKKVEIFYDDYGKPHLKGTDKRISISHTKQFVAVIMHDKKHVGIDIEIIAARIENISQRFLSTKEIVWTSENYSIEKLFVVWGAKESAFKIYAEGGIEFREMFEVRQFDYAQKGTTHITLHKNNVTCAYPVWWEQIGKLMLVYAIEN